MEIDAGGDAALIAVTGREGDVVRLLNPRS